LRYLFHEQFKLFDAYPAQGVLRDVSYLLWKEAEEPQKTAVREKVEDKIVHAFKLQKAFELAKAEAEKLAEKARTEGPDLRKSIGLADKAGAVVDAGPFSWLSSGVMPTGMGRLHLTEIPEVPYAGEEFMQTALDLQPGEVGVAPDQPHSKVYVIHVLSQTPTEELMQTLFMTRGLADRNIAQLHVAERMGMVNTWVNNLLEKEFVVHWNRTPQQYSGN